MLYELVTGRLPFEGDGPLAVISQHLHTQPRPPAELRPDLPPGLEQVILRLLAKLPEERYASPQEACRAVEVVAGLLGRCQEGVWLVELGGLGDAQLLPAAVAAVLNVREQTSRPLND